MSGENVGLATVLPDLDPAGGIDDPASLDPGVAAAADDYLTLDDFPQAHEEVVLARTWWWAVCLSLSAVALVANLIFIITVIYNR